MDTPMIEYEETYDDCETCNGRGTVYRWRDSQSSDKPIRREEDCRACNGKGWTLGWREVRSRRVR